MKKTKIIMTMLTVGLIALVVIVTLTNNPREGSTIDDVMFEDGVVNIYYFWQEGCPHCDAQFEFFERIEDEWGTYFNIYAFDVVSIADNSRLLSEVAGLLDAHVGGIPFTVIGEEVFTGFNARMEDDFVEAIEKGISNDFDVFRYIVDGG